MSLEIFRCFHWNQCISSHHWSLPPWNSMFFILLIKFYFECSRGGKHLKTIFLESYLMERVSPVQSLSRVWLFLTPWTAACQASLSITNSQFTQTQIHWVGDAIQPSHPLSSLSPPAFNLFKYQGLFQWVNSSHEVAKGLEFQLQHQSFWGIFRTDFL